MEAILIEQEEAMRAIARALPNIKKMGQNNFTTEKLRRRLQLLTEHFQRCFQLHVQLRGYESTINTQDLPYFRDAMFLQCEEVYEQTCDYIDEQLQILQPRTTSSPPDQIGGVAVGGASAYFGHPPPTFQLPQINLPTFSGDLPEWESFRDKFTALIINEHSLSEVMRFHYLFSCLKGEAHNIIKHLPITAVNFKTAWQLVSARYDNKRCLISAHLQTLVTLPSVSHDAGKELKILRDQANIAIQALKNLGEPVDQWDSMLVYLVTAKVDKPTRQAWELKLGDTTAFPKYPDLDNFLASRTRALEVLQTVTKAKPPPTRHVQTHAATDTTSSCSLCHQTHTLARCSIFQAKSAADRFAYVKSNRRCINCLNSTHTVKDCVKKGTCRTCNKRHHTMLHFPTDQLASSNVTTSSAPPDQKTTDQGSTLSPETAVSHLVSSAISPKASILLATAWVTVSSESGRSTTVRALLDQGSVTSLITENLVQRLRLSKRRVAVSISGVGDQVSSTKHSTTIQISPTNKGHPSFSTTALILRSLTRYIPGRSNESMSSWSHLDGLPLADSNPMSSHPIDIIIGADLYGLVLLDGIRTGSTNEPTAQNTIFGWIVSGPASSRSASASISALHCTTLAELDKDIRKFWEVEDIPHKTHLTPAEAQCEDHFVATHYRDSTGRYIVRLPFKGSLPLNIGESKLIAKKWLARSEIRLSKTPEHQAEYNEFLSEYVRLGHMRRVLPSDLSRSQCVYVPHHAVVRETSSTTRLRVVFNASSHTSNGTSLNDHLHTGPKLQTDLSAVIIRWRQYKYILTADIAKMYRQIYVDPLDVDYQRILWRRSPAASVEEYQLLTVTYGTAPAPYLALRVLHQLIKDEGSRFPLAVRVLRHHTYVDDCVFGAHDIAAARETRNQLIAILQTAQFHLRKWASNTPVLLQDLNAEDHGLACSKDLQTDENLKVLGVAWNPESDTFHFRVVVTPHLTFTKRSLLSTIARLFDPLGWVTPVTVAAKILMQQLWLTQADWDAPLTEALHHQWMEHYTQLPQLSNVTIPRWTHESPDTISYELHGFADASSVAYAAVIYSRVQTASGQIILSLVAAKSKVAPVKTMTIPRLELSAALLLCRLMQFVISTLHLESPRCHFWTDSTIVLYWLNRPAARWKTFVANRVAEIQTQFPAVAWRHVPTSDNPADCASRGMSPSQLIDHTLWWRGPPWLAESPEYWPPNLVSMPMESPPEERVQVAVHMTMPRDRWDLSERYSSWPRLLRVTAYVRRFIQRLRNQLKTDPCPSANSHQVELSSGALNPGEITTAKLFWVRYIQRDCFADELRCLRENAPLLKRSPLLTLNPYLDEHDVIRVGGRLQNAPLSDHEKHPIVLKSHALVTLIIQNAHLRSLHAGAQLTLISLRREFWILRSRQTVRAVLHKCVTCARERAATPQQLMGQLPSVRVTRPTRAFVHCGLDYAGPIHIRMSSGRGHKSQKAYIALFVCMATKAIHLELVTDYSTAAFLAAFKRFCARRGCPSTIYSDNGTTFQGADRELVMAFRSATRDTTLANRLATDRVEWKFIPPSAPHFGGLWEIGVRSVKYHLKRVVGAHTLTYEEFSTMLCQVEACLNSRPIAPLSDSLDDYDPLTPGHFLIGTAITAILEPSLLDHSESRLSRWQLVTRVSESFWRRWSQDYMQTLQQRGKWRRLSPNIKIGQLVLIKNANLPPAKWELARITACHPGDDGVVRVVTVKTASSQYKRPLVKLCMLPIDIDTVERAN